MIQNTDPPDNKPDTLRMYTHKDDQNTSDVDQITIYNNYLSAMTNYDGEIDRNNFDAAKVSSTVYKINEKLSRIKGIGIDEPAAKKAIEDAHLDIGMLTIHLCTHLGLDPHKLDAFEVLEQNTDKSYGINNTILTRICSIGSYVAMQEKAQEPLQKYA